MTEMGLELSNRGSVRLLAALTALLVALPIMASSETGSWKLLREAETLIAGETVFPFINSDAGAPG